MTIRTVTRTLVLHQLDDEVVAVGPHVKPDHTEANPSYYVPLVGDTTTLVIKPTEYSADADGSTYTGSIVQNLDALGQWWSTFVVARANLPTLTRWFGRVRIINASGAVQTVWGGDIEIDPGRQAQRSAPTTAPVLNNFLPQAANPDTTGATLAQLEAEVNQLKAALRAVGVIAT